MKWIIRKPFLALLISMAMVSLLPLFLNNLFYWRFRNTILGQQNDLVQSSLTSDVERLDRSAIEFVSSAMKLEKSLKQISFTSTQDDNSTRLKINNICTILKNELESGSPYVQSIYMYIKQNGIVIGNRGFYEEALSNGLLPKQLGVSSDTLSEIVKRDSYGEIIPLEDNGMVFIRTISRGTDRIPEKQLIFLIKNSFYRDLIEQPNQMGGLFLLEDAKNNILAYSNKSNHNISEEELLNYCKQNSGKKNIDFYGQQAVCYSMKAEKTGYCFHMILLNDRVLDSIKGVQVYYWIFLGSSLALGLFLSVFFSKNSAMSLNELVKYIQTQAGTESFGMKGLETIKNTVDTLIEKRKIDQDQLRHYKEEISGSFLKEMLLGMTTDKREYYLPKGCGYVVACFSVGDDMYPIGAVFAELSHMIERKEWYRTLLLDGSIVEVLGEDREQANEKRFSDILTEQVNQLRKMSKCDVFVAYSSLHFDQEEMERAFGEASMALLIIKKQPNINALGFSNCSFRASVFLRDWHHLDKQYLLSKEICECDYEEALRVLPSLFPSEFLDEYFPESRVSSLHLASLKYQFLHNLDSLCEEMEMDDTTRSYTLQKLIYCRNHRTLYKMMEEMLTGLARQPSNEKDNTDVGMVTKIKEYIDWHFANPQISVSSIADAFGMSSNNLSQLFSRKAEKGVLEYIHEVRVKKAEELLMNDRKMTNEQVAALVGYTSTLTFSRKFKSFYHLTPGEYRQTKQCGD